MTLEIHLELETNFAYSIKSTVPILHSLQRTVIIVCYFKRFTKLFISTSFIQLNSYYNVCRADLEIH